MVMPVSQRCPKCGTTFIGSDAIGGLCDSCIMDEVFDVPFKFWRCPDHRQGQVEWDGGVAKCLICGRTNKKASDGEA